MASFSLLLAIRTREYIIKNDAEILQQVASRSKDLLKRIINFRENNLTEPEREDTTVRALIEEGLRRVVKEHKGDRGFHLRKATFRGQGLRPEVGEGSWERLRDLIYEGRGA